jgi:hypothetical protein
MRFSWPRSRGSSGVRLEGLGSGSGFGSTFDVHSSQLFDVNMEISYANEDGRLIHE